jgi:uncharacterized membrane protein YtjA (UPF0391 family)
VWRSDGPGLAAFLQLLHRQRRAVAAPVSKEKPMLKWALIFAVIAAVAGLFGFTGIAASAAGIAKILFMLFLVLFIVVVLLALFGIGAAS